MTRALTGVAARALLAGAALLGGCAGGHGAVEPAPAVPVAPALPPAAMAYLYGSGEAAALAEQAYNGLLAHVRAALARARDERGRLPHQRAAGTVPRWPPSMVLAPGATAAMPERLDCGMLPPAVVLDMDETAVLNLGYEHDHAVSGRGHDPARWERWERTGADRVAAVPGAVAAVRALRALGVTVIVNTNRTAGNADATAAALRQAGLGTFRHGETLFLQGDVDGRAGKDGRRAAIAARFCVLAMAGDQLGDFADLFDPPGPAPAQGRRALPGVSPLRGWWGNGWFMLPNPVYGTGLGSGWDETFPPERRWRDAP